MNFYTLREAANAIAAQLHPDDAEKRAAQAERYWHILYQGLCDGKLVGRDADGRDPIDPKRLGSILAFSCCVINERDLNDWLSRLGNGVQVTGLCAFIGSAPGDMGVTIEGNGVDVSVSELPTSAELAKAFGPFLLGDRNSDWLKSILGDVRGRPRLRKIKRTKTVGKRELATWPPGGVALYLLEERHMTLASARDALEKHYPNDLSVLDHIQMKGHRLSRLPWAPKGA